VVRLFNTTVPNSHMKCKDSIPNNCTQPNVKVYIHCHTRNSVKKVNYLKPLVKTVLKI